MTYDPFAAEYLADPQRVWKRLRDEEPIAYNSQRQLWALSRYADVRSALEDFGSFSSAKGIMLGRIGEGYVELAGAVPTVIMQDPPAHGRYRALVAKVFSARALAGLEPLIRHTVVRLLDQARRSGRFDFVADVSSVVPSEVIGTILGIPPADRSQVAAHIAALLVQEPGSAEMPSSAVAAWTEFLGYCTDLVRARRADPGGDLLSQLTQATVRTSDGPQQLSEAELVGFCATLAAAGTQTVTLNVADASVALARNPDQRSVVARDPSLVPRAFAESLRLMGTSAVGRTTTRDLTLHGQLVPEGSTMALLIGSANRDEREFDRPDDFNIWRPNQRALSFGAGIHFCLGAQLARMECHIILEELLMRMPDYEIDETGLDRIGYSNFHGFASVPMSAAKGDRRWLVG